MCFFKCLQLYVTRKSFAFISFVENVVTKNSVEKEFLGSFLTWRKWMQSGEKWGGVSVCPPYILKIHAYPQTLLMPKQFTCSSDNCNNQILGAN